MRPLVLLTAALVAGAPFQAPLTAQAATRAVEPVSMKPLEWLVGRWTGTGSMMAGPGARTEAAVKETATRHAGGHVLMLEGLGTADGKVVHDAFAVIWYDAEKGTHRMRGFRANGHVLETDVAVTDRRIVWGFPGPRGGNIRFTVTHTDAGQWHEVGEFSGDGSTWQQFMEMTLAREPGS